MTSKVSSSAELLTRWRRIEEDEEENDDSDPSTVRRLNQRKEQWFTSFSSSPLTSFVKIECESEPKLMLSTGLQMHSPC